MYATELIYRDPARRTTSAVNRESFCDLCHEIAVESREAESMSSFVGEHTARTYNQSVIRPRLIRKTANV